MPGASRKTEQLTLILMFVLAGWHISHAEEFGNLLVPSVENQSRQASATALGAISSVIKGFQSRELKQSGAESFSSAVKDLKSAAEQMNDVIRRESSDPELQRVLAVTLDPAKDIPDRDRGLYAFWAVRLGTDPKAMVSKGQLFRMFAQDTQRLAVVIEGSASGPPDRTTFRRIVDDLTVYLRMGDVVASALRNS